MPTVTIEGRYRFVVNTRENAFEPPHVHVWVGKEDVRRIELLGGRYMDEPPPGDARSILEAYARHLEAIWETWHAVHGR